MRSTLGCCWLLSFLASITFAGEITTIAGNGKPADTGAAGKATESGINQPFGVEIGPGGALYITEVGKHRVRRVDLKTGELTTVAGNGRKGYSGDGGPATSAELNEPYEVRFDADGNMFFVEMMNHVVRRVDAKTGVISTIAGTGKAGFGGDGGPATKAELKQPHSIALDGKGFLYIADIGNHRIRRLDLAKGTIDTIAGTGASKLPVAGAKAAGSPVAGPRALYITGSTLWVALREGNGVWSIELDPKQKGEGTWKHIAGTGKAGYSGDGGPASAATFNGPKGIVVTVEGKPDRKIHIVDTENQAIRTIDIPSGKISTLAGTGPKARGYSGDLGPATSAKMDRPHGICIDAAGKVFIGDTNNHRVRVVGP